MLQNLQNSIGFDLGSGLSRFYRYENQLFEKPTLIEIDKIKYENIIRNGKIADFNGIYEFLKREIKIIKKPFLGIFRRPFYALVSVPSDLNQVALRTYRDIMNFIGAKECYLICDCFVAGIGLELDLSDSTNMIVDFGAGKTSITTFRGPDIVKNDILDIAGLELNKSICNYLLSKYNLVIDLKEAEKLKIEYGDYRKGNSFDWNVRITGKKKQSDYIKDISISSNEIKDCMQLDIDLLIERIQRHFENLDDNDIKSIESQGIYLIGGGFKMKGLVGMISEKLKIADRSFNFSTDYMKNGFEKIQKQPKKYLKYIFT